MMALLLASPEAHAEAVRSSIIRLRAASPMAADAKRRCARRAVQRSPLTCAVRIQRKETLPGKNFTLCEINQAMKAAKAGGRAYLGQPAAMRVGGSVQGAGRVSTGE